MSLISLKRDNCDQRTTDIVTGYIRQCQKLLSNDNVYYNIPSLVTYLCLNFYWIREYFTDHGEMIQLNKDKNIAKQHKYGYGNVYGNITIDNKPCIYIWTFKVIKTCNDMMIELIHQTKNFVIKIL